MSSCRSCGSCPKYFPTPSGKCDYCDCPSTDHASQAPLMQPQMQMAVPQQPMFSPTQDILYPQPFQMPQQYPTQPDFQQQQFMPMAQPYIQPTQYNPNMNQFPQYNPFQPYGGMPMMPPNQPYMGKHLCNLFLHASCTVRFHRYYQ